METFDVGRLTDFDFEAVCKDLFELEFGVRLEIFTSGPDGGVDLRHMQGDDPALIVQCKHFPRSGRAKLLAHMRKTEAPKLAYLKPGRYVLATSVELSRAAKDKLYDMLQPFVRSPGDIYGKDDIDALLRKHDQVVRRHLRLWLTSASVLNSLISKSIVTRSHALADAVKATLHTYADNGSLGEALRLLDDRHVCVVAGAPGVGKTTLSHVLCAHYVSHGYDIVEISEDVEEANALWDPDVPQLFYYDDFLGQTAIDEKLGKNEDGRLLSLMQRTVNSPNKRFLLTTREYILAQARQKYERLDRHRFDVQTCVLDVADYTYEARASILYNHVSASSLPARTKSIFASPGAYVPVVQHENFNPRVIAATLSEAVAFGTTGKHIASEMIANLNDPARVWGHIVNHQIGAFEILLLKTQLSFLSGIRMDTLEGVWVSSGGALQDLRSSLKVLDGTMLRSVRHGEVVFVEFHNPSVRDYMRDFISSDHSEMKDFVGRIRLFEQVESLWSMLSSRNAEQVLQALMRCMSELERSTELAFRAETVVVRGHYSAHDSAHRALLFLELGIALGSERVHDIGWRSISEGSVISEAWDAQTVQDILGFLGDSKRQDLREFFPRAVDQAAEWIMELDLPDRRSLSDALDFASLLTDFEKGEEVHEYVVDRMDEYAEWALESWMEHSDGSRYELPEMEAIFRHYESGDGDLYRLDEEMFTKVRARVEASASSHSAQRTPRRPAPARSIGPTAAEREGVARMMATLTPDGT